MNRDGMQKLTRCRMRAGAVLATASLILASSICCAASHLGKNYWGFYGGYGRSYPGWGETTEKLETIDFVGRYCRVLDRDVGRGWYRCNHEFWCEFTVMDLVEPDKSAILSMNFLGVLVFTASDSLQPYFTAGGGPLYALPEIEGMGSNLCGNYQAGGGLRLCLDDTRAVSIEARYHHISNLGMDDPNVPINSTKFFAGFTFSF